jgi:hypothetical protein
MIEAIMLGVIGIPVVLLGVGIWICCGVAIWDAVGAYRGSKTVDKLMRRRWLRNEPEE